MFGNLFGSKTEETVYDPYKHMPGWQEDYYKDTTKQLTKNIGLGKEIRDDLLNNPQQWENLSEQERMALEELARSGDTADQYTQGGLDLISMIPGMSDEMTQRLTGEGGAMFDYLAGGGYGDVPTTQEEMDQYYARFEDPYLEDVVDTSLAGMDRNYQRELAARNASVASVGGLNNTRAAVQDALAGQLHGMDRAQLEAQLRSDAFKTSRDYGMREAGDLFGRTMDIYGAGRDDLTFRAGQEGDNIARIFESAKGLDQLGGSQFDRAASLYAQRAAQGQAQREINDANREAQRTAGKDAVSWFAGLVPNPMGSAPGVSYTQEEKPSTFGKILGTAANVAGAFIGASDENVKTDITIDETSALDKLAKIPTYEYRYKEGEGHRTDRTAGMMAQDVENAGIVGGTLEVDGVKHVDAFPVMATIVQAVRELDARTKDAA